MNYSNSIPIEVFKYLYRRTLKFSDLLLKINRHPLDEVSIDVVSFFTLSQRRWFFEERHHSWPTRKRTRLLIFSSTELSILCFAALINSVSFCISHFHGLKSGSRLKLLLQSSLHQECNRRELIDVSYQKESPMFHNVENEMRWEREPSRSSSDLSHVQVRCRKLKLLDPSPISSNVRRSATGRTCWTVLDVIRKNVEAVIEDFEVSSRK